MTSETKNKAFIIGGIFIALFITVSGELFIANEEYGYRVIFFPAFIVGIISFLYVWYFCGIKKEVLHSVAPFYTLPTFFIIFLTCYNPSRVITGAFGMNLIIGKLQKYFLRNNLDLDRFAIYKPTYGYITEFLFGLTLCLSIAILIDIIKTKTFKKRFIFNKKHLLYFLIPLATSYIDTISASANYLNKNAFTMFSSKSDFKNNFISYIGATLFLLIIFIACAISIFLISNKINLNKKLSITALIISSFFGVLRLTLIFFIGSEINYESYFSWLTSRFIDYSYELTLLMSVIFAISLNSLLNNQKSNLTSKKEKSNKINILNKIKNLFDKIVRWFKTET